jgi:hypothetical protein
MNIRQAFAHEPADHRFLQRLFELPQLFYCQFRSQSFALVRHVLPEMEHLAPRRFWPMQCSDRSAT